MSKKLLLPTAIFEDSADKRFILERYLEGIIETKVLAEDFNEAQELIPRLGGLGVVAALIDGSLPNQNRKYGDPREGELIVRQLRELYGDSILLVSTTSAEAQVEGTDYHWNLMNMDPLVKFLMQAQDSYIAAR